MGKGFIFEHFSDDIPCDKCEGLYWKNDVSQDSIVGHMWFYPIFAEILNDNHLLQKRVVQGNIHSLRDLFKLIRIFKAFLDVVDRIVENGYTMPDWDGKRTTWGFWNPEELNQNIGLHN